MSIPVPQKPGAKALVPDPPAAKEPAKQRVVREYIGVYRDPNRDPKAQWVCAVVTWDGSGVPHEEIIFATHAGAIACAYSAKENARRMALPNGALRVT